MTFGLGMVGSAVAGIGRSVDRAMVGLVGWLLIDLAAVSVAAGNGRADLAVVTAGATEDWSVDRAGVEAGIGRLGMVGSIAPGVVSAAGDLVVMAGGMVGRSVGCWRSAMVGMVGRLVDLAGRLVCRWSISGDW